MTNIFITGATGYLGGDLVAEIREDPKYDACTIYTLVRNKSLWPEFEKRNFKPVIVDLDKPQAIKDFITEKKIDIVVEMTDAGTDRIGVPAIEALAPRKGKYIASNGTKQWSLFSGFDTTQPLYDDQPDFLPFIKERTKGAYPYPTYLRSSAKATPTMWELAESKGVGFHSVAPCMIYGPSRTLGNPISIQIVGLVRIAKALGHLVEIPHPEDSLPQIWVQCHIKDCTDLYKLVLDKAIEGAALENGLYFAENGFFSWDELNKKVAEGCGVPVEPRLATQEEIDIAAKALNTHPQAIPAEVAGRCNVVGRRGRRLGWKPKYDTEYLYAHAADEARYILSKI